MTDGKIKPLGHLALLASAGSGKTTRLCQRYIRLLADGDLKATPDRICALTFTRKAAGEIFDRVVGCLCGGAADENAAAKLAGDLGLPGLGRPQFAGLLRLFLDNLHRAVIGTLDSFVGGVVRAFPIELGIPLEFEVSESKAAAGAALRKDILADILAARGPGANQLLAAFKQATFGIEEKSFERFLNDVIIPLHLSYRFCPDPEKWGNASLIWTGQNQANAGMSSQPELREQAQRVQRWLEAERQKTQGLDQRLQASLPALAEALAAHGLASPWSPNFSGAFFERLLQQRSGLRQGPAAIQYGRSTIQLPAAIARALAVLMDNLVAVEIRRALEKTRGLHDLLELYDRAYDRESRESGRFSFADLQCLLAPGDSARGVLPLSRERAEGRLFIDYRLDSRLDHWLLDEFQDTSDLQWAIFSNLVAELVQGDPEGYRRSFFYVGDVKQSIYRWRGGNPGLFLDLRAQFNQAGDVIRLDRMSDTRRCAQPVIDAVNQVFAELPAAFLPAGAIAAWKTVWDKHGTLNREASGCAVLLQPEPADDPAGARYQLVADLLNEIQPGRRGLGVGILLRTNEACSGLVNVLRRECQGMGFVHEGQAGIARNELAQALLALVRLAAHPGDEFAWQYVRMSPLAGVLDEKQITRSRLAPLLLTEIEAAGFQALIAEWGSRLEAVGPLNEYGRQCLARLAKAAAEFDGAGSRSCNRFLEFVGDYEVHEEAARGAVRIMTIHQAKGLEFDLVILPELQHATGMNMARAQPADRDILYGGKPFAPRWILKAPKKEIAENDPVLGARLRKIDEDYCFDQLCTLYVAMTRAKQALYMLASPGPKKSEVFRPAALLKLQLAGDVEPEAGPGITINGKKYARLYSAASGDERWYASKSFLEFQDRGPAAGPAASAAGFAGRASRRQVLPRSEPSRQEIFRRQASALFDPETRDVLDFGSAIHELFAKIDWLDVESGAEAIIRAWRPAGPYDQQVATDACRQFRKCLQAAEVREALARPAGQAELWREKSFEIILDGRWVSGIFDRVVINRGADGVPAGAAILDFKSNRNLKTEADLQAQAGHYRPQMELYRRALSGLLGLAADRIAIQLLFTVPARIVVLASDP